MKKSMRKTALGMIAVMLTVSLTACGASMNRSTYDGLATTSALAGGREQSDFNTNTTYEYEDSSEPFNTEEYNAITENAFSSVEVNPLSTFSIDVDTASYSNVRRMIQSGYQPQDIPVDSVRIEEMLNYFDYNYDLPNGEDPFAISVAATDAPWNTEHGLLRIGLNTEAIDFSEAPKSNLVFLIDVSGSMDSPDKLPLLKEAFTLLTENLGEKDRVSIVTYAASEEVVLDGARGDDKELIMNALYNLDAGGSTNGSGGIQGAYDLAQKYLIEGGNNRVILATDGDLNVGITNESDLQELITKEKESGIYLSVLGFGTGNIKDNKMEILADSGNGNYAYIDNVNEAQKVLVEEMGSTLLTVAEDVKIQIEFNPAWIQEYRLIGYENRMLNAQDFTDDTKDAGEVGAGHSVTALYEVVWANTNEGTLPDLIYQQNNLTPQALSEEWGTLRIRYKRPHLSESIEMQSVFGLENYNSNIEESDLLLEASVAEFGLLLRNSEYKANADYAAILTRWSGKNVNAEVAEFLELVETCNKAN